MSNCSSETIEQEYYGWIGNGIFITAQIAQIIHTYSQKKTEEISYILEIMWIIGNAMYTAFGYIDNSLSMFYGNFCSLLLSIIQIIQKIYYDKKNKNNKNKNKIVDDFLINESRQLLDNKKNMAKKDEASLPKYNSFQ